MHHYLKRYLILIVSYLNFIREKNTLRNLFVFWSYWVNNRGWVTKKIIYLIRCPRGNLKCHPGWSNNPATNRLWIISEHQKKCLTSIIFCFSKRDATRAHAHTHTHSYKHTHTHTSTHSLVQAHTHTHTHTHTLVQAHTHSQSYKHTHTCSHTHTHTHTRTSTHAHTLAHTRSHFHTHSHTHTRTSLPVFKLWIGELDFVCPIKTVGG